LKLDKAKNVGDAGHPSVAFAKRQKERSTKYRFKYSRIDVQLILLLLLTKRIVNS